MLGQGRGRWAVAQILILATIGNKFTLTPDALAAELPRHRTKYHVTTMPFILKNQEAYKINIDVILFETSRTTLLSKCILLSNFQHLTYFMIIGYV